MLLAGRLLLPDDHRPGHARLATGTVRLDGERIAEVNEFKNDELARSNTLIAPGFVDTHLHLPQFDTVGAHGRPLLAWLDEVTVPAERRWEDADYARAMTRRVVRQLLAHGTTAVAAYATVHHAAARAALEVVRDAGLRGVVGQTLIERHAPGFLCRPAAQLLDEAAELLDAFPAGGRVAAAVTPRFAATCSARLMADLGRLAAERDAVVQSHLAETVAECAWIAELFGGKRYIDVYADAGLLTPRSVYGHGIHLDDTDRKTLADTGAVVAHCPTANTFLRSGTMDRRAHLDRGVRLSLGSDVGAGYDRSMVRVARAMVEAAATLGRGGVPSAAEAWWQITAGNAEALGWLDAGRLVAGASADVLVVEPDVPWLASSVDPLDVLLWSWDDRWLKRTFVRGTPAYDAG